jgi:hypothetical protein
VVTREKSPHRAPGSVRANGDMRTEGRCARIERGEMGVRERDDEDGRCCVGRTLQRGRDWDRRERRPGPRDCQPGECAFLVVDARAGVTVNCGDAARDQERYEDHEATGPRSTAPAGTYQAGSRGIRHALERVSESTHNANHLHIEDRFGRALLSSATGARVLSRDCPRGPPGAVPHRPVGRLIGPRSFAARARRPAKPRVPRVEGRGARRC